MITRKAILLLALSPCVGCTSSDQGAVEDASILHANPRVAFATAPLIPLERKQPSPPPPPKKPTASRPRLRLVSSQTEALYRSFFPLTDDAATNALKDSATFYNEESMPRLYQVWDRGASSGIESSDERESANNEFPWAGPAGTQSRDQLKTIRFVKLDRPIEWFRRFRNGTFDGFGWRYPTGTTFGEILLVTDPQGFDHTFELRTRRKNSDGDWTVNSFRPFPQERNLHDALAARGIDFETGAPFDRYLDSGHENQPFRAGARFVRLPRMPPGLVASLLDGSTFQSARYKSWALDADGVTTQSSFSIVPSNFLGGMFAVDRESCARCHADAGRVVNLPDEQRWRLRGSDRIFSFHIFSPQARGLNLEFNPKLVRAGLLVHQRGAQ